MEEKDIQEQLLEEESEEISEVVDENEEKLYLLEVEIQELTIQLDKLEEQQIANGEEEYSEEYIELRKKYNELIKEKKQILKDIRKNDTSKLNQVSIWVILFGIITVLISLPFISAHIWLSFVNVISDLLTGSFSNLDQDGILFKIIIFLIIFAFPLLLNIIVWEVYINLVKTKTDKKVFIGFWIVQGLMNLGMIIFMCFQLYGA